MKQLLLATLTTCFILLVTRSMAEARTLLDRSRYAPLDLQDPDDVAELLINLEEIQQQVSPYAYNSYNVKRTGHFGHFGDSTLKRQEQERIIVQTAQDLANDPTGPGRKRQAPSRFDLYRLN